MKLLQYLLNQEIISNMYIPGQDLMGKIVSGLKSSQPLLKQQNQP